MKGLISDIFSIMPSNLTKKIADWAGQHRLLGNNIGYVNFSLFKQRQYTNDVHTLKEINVARNALHLVTVGYFNERIEQ